MRKVVLSLVAIAAVTVSGFAGEGKGKYNTAVAVGDKAPTFSGLPAISSGEQTSVSLSDIKSDVVVVVFLANHCPVVKGYEDRLVEFTKDYKSKGVTVVGISVSQMNEDKLPGIKDYMKDHGSNYAYAYDESQEVGKAYGAIATPSFFVLDKERTIRYMGAMDDNGTESKVTKTYVRDAVDALLAGKAPEVTETRAKGCGIGYTK
jgi:peroxiredoxin